MAAGPAAEEAAAGLAAEAVVGPEAVAVAAEEVEVEVEVAARR